MRIGTNYKFLENIANHPRVFKYVTCAGIHSVDLSNIWKDCIAIEFDTGGFLFHKQDDGVYEVHTLFLPKSKNVYDYAKQAAEYMFTHGATLLLTQVARDLPHVRRLALKQGFVKFSEGIWIRDSGSVISDYYELTKDAWMEGLRCQS